MKAKALTIAVIALLGYAFSLPVLAADTSDMLDGMEQFSYKRYHAATDLFERVIAQDPRNTRAHYYLGMCFERLKDAANAKQEYDAAFHLNPFSDEGHASREALLHLSGSVEEGKHPTDGPKVYDQAVREINRQAADNAQRWVDWGNSNANYRTRLGAIEAGMKRQQAKYATNALRNSTYGREISNQHLLDASYQLSDAQVQANKYRQDGTNAARFTYESANSLKQQLGEHRTNNDSLTPRLRALGTNLYVRNYGDYDDDLPPADPPLELRAKAKSFADLPVELKAAPGKL
ncbi:MAG TPA: tetratricopeptide repeat protein [Planktothrix sp.]|jgi:hypothetical protein